MTSVSGGQGQPGPLAGGTSSFGQFRLTTFVDSTPKPTQVNATAPVSRIIPADEVTGIASTVANDEPMISSSHALMASSRIPQVPPHPVGEPPSIPTKSAASLVPVMDTASSAHNGFGIIDLASPAGAEGGGGKLGPHRDGRVRNPVPSKLKGKTDNRNGNFAVMHMDMSGSAGGERLQRGEAAQRTSESTAQAAMSAQKDGYKPLKRIRLEPPSNPSPKPQPQPPSQQRPPENPPSQAPQFIPPTAQREPVRRTRPLTTEETKYEQARLLTLLRSINPLTVVDQMCKALAFFGGIPGAPPPQDGRFPESAESNGSGTLFVGWLSEIFPDLERRAWKPEVPVSVPVSSQDPIQTIAPPSLAPVVHEASRIKRPRGRPKGSKATKVRKDKGIKKGPKFARKGDIGGLHDSSFQPLQPVSGQINDVDDAEEEWIDVGGSEIQLERSGSPDDPDMAPGPNPAGVSNQLRTHENSMEIAADDELISFSHSSQPLPATANIGKRRPGRPRGSRNRPKEAETSNLQPPQPPLPVLNNQQIVASESSPAPGSQTKRRPARPSVPKTAQAMPDSTERGIDTSRDINDRPVPMHPFPPQPSEILGQTISPTPMNGVSTVEVENNTQHSGKKATKKTRKDVELASNSTPQLLGLNAEEQAVLEAFRNARAAQAGNQPSADKRKRPRPQSVTQSQDASSGNAGIISLPSAVSIPAGSDRMTEAAAHTVLAESPQKSSPVPTPNKRQRKPKTSEGSMARKKQDTTTSESTTAPISRNVISNNSTFPVTTVTTEATMTAPRALAQGLEAHYEHFAHLQQQQEQQQQPPRREQNSVARSSPAQGSPFYQQTTTHVAPSYQQQYTSHQGPPQYHNTQSSQNDTFRVINNQQPTNSFSPRQSTSQFTPFPDSSFIDLPALESVANGTAHVGAFGPGVSRSATQGSFGTGTGIGNGFDGALSDNELRERLLRGIGRR